MQQVADWLEKLGLGQYAAHFAENDISFFSPIRSHGSRPREHWGVSRSSTRLEVSPFRLAALPVPPNRATGAQDRDTCVAPEHRPRAPRPAHIPDTFQ